MSVVSPKADASSPGLTWSRYSNRKTFGENLQPSFLSQQVSASAWMSAQTPRESLPLIGLAYPTSEPHSLRGPSYKKNA
jgi:hypothetical protein